MIFLQKLKYKVGAAGRPFALLLLLICHPFEKAFATHSVAADITYTYLGTQNNYRFEVHYYRDCSGIPAPTSIALTMQAQNCNGNAWNYTITLALTSGPSVIPPVCYLGPSTCNGGSIWGVEEYVYSLDHNLPGNCSDWVFSYAICCRNNSILNIVSPGSQTQYFYSTLNNMDVSHNSGLQFNESPVPFRCTNGPFCIDLSATDSDVPSDSIVYDLVTPLGSNGAPLAWAGGFSASQPIPSSPAMTFNPQTGQACIWPTMQGQYVLAVRATEYRNGVEVGSVHRDMQINMVPCPCMCLPPVGLLATNISGTTAKLKWTKAISALFYEVRFRVQGTTAWTVKKTAQNSGSKTISGLLPYTTYEWKVRTLCAVNPKVWSGWSPKELFTTKCVPPLNPHETDVTSSGAKLKWTKWSNAVSYEVRYRELGATTWIVKKTAQNHGAKIISGLSASTAYEWKVRTRCAISPKIWSGWSPKIQFMTLPPAPVRIPGMTDPGSSPFSVSISPVPAIQYLDARTNAAVLPLYITVRDLLGRTWSSLGSMSDGFRLETGSMPAGVYFLEIRSGTQVARTRFVKK